MASTAASYLSQKHTAHARGKSMTIGWMSSQHAWTTSRMGEGSGHHLWLCNTKPTSRACLHHATPSWWLTETDFVVAIDQHNGEPKG